MLLVSPGRARTTWTDRTRRPWRSAGVTGDPGPHSTGTHGRYYSTPIFFCFVSFPCLSVHLLLQGPPGVKGEKGDHGLTGLQVMGQGDGGDMVGLSPAYDVGPCLVDYLCSLSGPLWPARYPRENWPTGTKGTGSRSRMMCGREWAQVEP